MDELLKIALIQIATNRRVLSACMKEIGGIDDEDIKEIFSDTEKEISQSYEIEYKKIIEKNQKEENKNG